MSDPFLDYFKSKRGRIRFLIEIALSDTLASSLRRANVYNKKVTEKRKQEFGQYFKQELSKLQTEYINTVDEEKHIERIRTFRNSLSQDSFCDILQNKRIKFGIAQKGVNLFLKYLWSLDMIPEPPHCPIDAIVLQQTPLKDVRWTQIDNLCIYREIISECRKKAGYQSLSQWELELWNNKK